MATKRKAKVRLVATRWAAYLAKELPLGRVEQRIHSTHPFLAWPYLGPWSAHKTRREAIRALIRAAKESDK